MFALYLKYRNVLSIMLYVAVWAGLIWWIDAAKLSIPIELWDNVATIGWSLVPVALVWVLCALAKNLREYRTRQQADTALVLAQVENMNLNNAWQAQNR